MTAYRVLHSTYNATLHLCDLQFNYMRTSVINDHLQPSNSDLFQWKLNLK